MGAPKGKRQSSGKCTYTIGSNVLKVTARAVPGGPGRPISVRVPKYKRVDEGGLRSSASRNSLECKADIWPDSRESESGIPDRLPVDTDSKL